MKRSILLLAGMVMSGAAAVLPNLAASGLVGPPPSLVVSLAAALAVLTFGLGLLAWRHRSHPDDRMLVLVVILIGCTILTSVAIGMVPPLRSGWVSFVGAQSRAALFGNPAVRLLGNLGLFAWMLLFAMALPRAARNTVRVVAVAVLAIQIACVPWMVERGADRLAGRMWPRAAGMAGQQMPELRLLDVNGSEVALDGFRGKVILINVWRTW